MEDCCAVCAEPLAWVAYGRCGHKEACSKCVTRLRFVLADNRCVICQQSLQAVLVTKWLGSYTRTLAAAEFDALQEQGNSPALHHLRVVNAYFEDKQHFEEIRRLCSYTHPALAEAGERSRAGPHQSLGGLKKALQLQLGLHFCDLCLESRKVFLPEQILYTKQDLARHQRTGDLEGVLAESGFQGHPMCRFCSKRFFGESELFVHMQQTHEQCHICKRANPNKFEYFNTYDQLEEHFRHEHFLCGHPVCVERKFVVFRTEQELTQHNALEHAGTMSRAERRQALTIPIHIQTVNSSPIQVELLALSRPYRFSFRVTSNGDSPLPTEMHEPMQYSRQPTEPALERGARRHGQRARATDPHQLATALQASMDTAQRERSQGEASEGPSVALDDRNFPSMGPSSATPFSAAGYGASAAGRAAPGPEDFPALPGTSKHAKRRNREREREQARTLAERLGRPVEVRVLNSGAQPASRADAFPALGGSAVAAAAPSAAPRWQPGSRPQTTAGPSEPTAPDAGGFPSLARANGGAAVPSPSMARAVGPSGPRNRDTGDEYPVLGGGSSGAAGLPSSRVELAEAPRPREPTVRGISEGLKAANKVLVEKIKRQLDASKFGEFRAEAARFAGGEVDATTYHRHVAGLGLAALVPDMAALLPDPEKRAELLRAHEASPTTSGRWVPPEAAAAALRVAKTQPSWQCPACTLLNEPRAGTCEACHAKRPMNDLAALSRASSGGGVSGSHPSEAGGKKQQKVPKFERLRLTSGGRDPEAQAEAERRTKPGNAWTQRHSPATVPPAPKTKSAWAGQSSGKLASQINGLQDAWSKR